MAERPQTGPLVIRVNELLDGGDGLHGAWLATACSTPFDHGCSLDNTTGDCGFAENVLERVMDFYGLGGRYAEGAHGGH